MRAGGAVHRGMILLVAIFGASCRGQAPPSSPAGAWDLGSSFAGAVSAPSSVRDFPLVRAGERHAGVALIAPARLSVPVGASRGAFDFHCLAAPVYNVGDGTKLEIYREGREGRRKLFERYFDAARRSEDRRWTTISVPLDVGDAGVQIVLVVSGGARGDMVADWLAIAEPRLSRRTGGQ
jgi:hypothetical protein